MKYDYIFWDWNGTLIDDVEISIQSVNISLAKRNLPLMTLERYDRTFSFPVIDYYKGLGFDFNKEPYDKLAIEYMDNYMSLLPYSNLKQNAQSVLKRFFKLKVPQFILSASEKSLLLSELKKHSISEYFTDVIALDNIYAKGKIELAKEWFARNPLEGKKVLIGDMPHDFEVASALDMDCALICGGHSTREKLEKLGAPVFSDIKEVFNYILDIPNQKSAYKYRNGKGEDIKNYDFSEVALSKTEAFKISYKDFYDDVKNTTKTEDW